MKYLESNRVLIAGGSGLIGKSLCKHLTDKGFVVSILSRSNKPSKYEKYLWNPDNKSVDLLAFRNQDYIINLAGCGIADKYWTKKRKKEIISTRIKSVELLAKGIRESGHIPKKIIQASAIGYYGNKPKGTITEKDISGNDFLSSVCQQWEKSAKQYKNLNIQHTILRIGIVLSLKGGYLLKLNNGIKFRLNILFGSGEQNISWIHIEDLNRIFSYCLSKNNTTGIYNATSPYPVSSKQIQNSITQVFDKKTLLIKIHSKILRLFLRDFSNLFLADQSVIPMRLMTEGFNFKYETLSKALKQLYHSVK